MKLANTKTNPETTSDLPDLDALFYKYYERLYDVAYRITQSKFDAEDVIQDVFVKLHCALAGFADRASIETWMYRITINASLDFERNKNRRRALNQSDNTCRQTQSTYQKPDMFVNNEVSILLDNALQSIEPRFRVVVVLRDFEEMSYTQIADVLELSPGTVASRLNRAYRKLAGALKKAGIDETYIKS